jgi:Flp pilus assembly protein TadD
LPFFGQPAPAEAPQPLVIASPIATPAPAPAAEPPALPPAAVVEAPAPPPAPVEPPLPPIDAATRASFDEAARMLRANRLPEAERAFQALVAKQPALAGAHANLGLIHRKAGRLDESAAALLEAVKLAPKQAAFHNQLGITWRTLGRFDHARKAYETAIDLDPTHAGALMNLAILHDVYLGDAARATELYTRSAALLPAEAATINKWLAEIKSRKADPKLAASAPANGAPAAGAAPPSKPAAPAAPATGGPTPPRKEKE